MKRKIIIGVSIVAVIAIAYFVISGISRKNANASEFQTVPLARGQLTALVGATGTVRANQTTQLSWQTTGRIDEVFVKVDDVVYANDILASLAPESLSQQIILARADLVSAQRTLDDLKNSNLASAQAYQNMVLAQKELDDAREKRESKQYGRAGAETLDIARANLIIAEDKVTNAERYYDTFDSLEESNPMRAQAFATLAQAKQERDTTLANLNWLLGRPDEQEVAEVNARVQVAEAKVADTTREWERLKDGPDPSDIAAAEARVASINATLGLAQIQAPISGTVTMVNAMVGDEVSPGSVAFRIDDISHLLVDVDVPEVDINRIKTGQPVTLSFDSITGQEYEGVVSEVARVGTMAGGVVNFRVTIELKNPDAQVLPSMTAAVNIIVNQLENVLLIPNRAVRLREGERVVFVLRSNLPVAVPIQIGATSDTYSEMLSGDIQEGELIILNPPSAELQNAMFGMPR